MKKTKWNPEQEFWEKKRKGKSNQYVCDAIKMNG